MELMHTWVPWAWLGAAALVVLAVLVVRRLRRRRAAAGALRMAHGERLADLPRYRALARRYRLFAAVAVLATLMALASAAALSARVIEQHVSTPEQRTREIMLCLDVSGSMQDSDLAILRTYEQLVEEFQGERIGLTIFDSSAASIFPLTTDYDYVAQELERVRGSFDYDYDSPYPSIYSGTSLGDGSSLIGDGLASCVLRFEKTDEKRSRSIILATDNYTAGDQLVTLTQAGALAQQQDILIYAIDPNGSRYGSEYISDETRELKQVAGDSGGRYFGISDERAVPQVTTAIRSREAARSKGTPVRSFTDEPRRVVIASFAALTLLLGAAWRMRL